MIYSPPKIPQPFFIAAATYAGQGLSYSKWEVELLDGVWPSAASMAWYLDQAHFGGSYDRLSMNKNLLFAYRD